MANKQGDDMSGRWSEWKRTTAVIKWTRGCTALPECCSCRRPANETQVQVYRIDRGTPIDEIPYCLPIPRFRCEPGKGCNAAPWSRAGSGLRSEMATWDGPWAFVRKRDGRRLVIAD
jgi:hypothetical protein